MLFFFSGGMNMINPMKELTRGERLQWLASVAVVALSFALSGGQDPLSAVASLIGVTALIFVAKGYVLGQVLTVVFAVFYGVISWYFRYYGEMITYLGMTAPIALMAVISWLRHPYKGSKEVAVQDVTGRQLLVLAVLTAVVTALFGVILHALGTVSLVLSTISVATSFIASALTWLRSPYYALGYAANDVVLIGLWVLAAMESISCLPMTFCFVMFLINDLYGYFNWQRMRRRQQGA